jgi:hypothetical protein
MRQTPRGSVRSNVGRHRAADPPRAHAPPRTDTQPPPHSLTPVASHGVPQPSHPEPHNRRAASLRAPAAAPIISRQALTRLTGIPAPSQSVFAGVFGPMQAGVILAVSGNLVIACALALQKWVHNTIANRPVEQRQPASRHPLFWVALMGLMVGEVGNFAAFGLASPTVVSPLGAVAVVANPLI